METLKTLNVFEIEPRLKHPTIFNWFDELAPGNAFIIHNDHDPKPLYYQLLGERGNIFNWEYLQEGPEYWKVKIGKNPLDNAGKPTVGEIAAKDYRKAEVFKRMGIDFCCGGKKTLSEACAEVGISEAQLEAELQKVEGQKASPAHNYDNWELDFLTDYIINTHHRYVKDNLDLLYGLSHKVASHHGENHPELLQVARAYVNMATELKEHMEKEENILFPYIKEIVKANKEGRKVNASPFGTIENPIQMMMDEHTAAGEDFSTIRKASNNYFLPEGACNSYNFLYEKLKEFEEDLNLHIHLENNILFPKAIALEKNLTA